MDITQTPYLEIVDLSRELFHRTQVHPAHPPVVMTVWNDHDEIKRLGQTTHSSKAIAFSMSDHSGTHVDAPIHFDGRPGARTIDQLPLENFITEAICLDLSHVELGHAVTVTEMEQALIDSGEQILPGDTVLLYMRTNERLLGTPGFLHDFPGLSLAAVHWLADRGIGMFGVEAISPAPHGELNYRAHIACAERGITHIECLTNLDALVGRGRFHFAGLPLNLRGGTGGPMRATALFNLQARLRPVTGEGASEGFRFGRGDR